MMKRRGLIGALAVLLALIAVGWGRTGLPGGGVAVPRWTVPSGSVTVASNLDGWSPAAKS